MTRRPSELWLYLFLSFLLNACTWSAAPKPSVLVILVENMSFSSFSCGDTSRQEGPSGFRVFCDEAVRFTHAYAPSTLSQASTASIMTGLYPLDHGVRHNGSLFISAKTETVAEKALQDGVRTAFFSGGPPVLRKGGLAQGFEVFDDNFTPSLKTSYRPVRENFAAFLNWQELEASRPFLGMIYLPDLQFVDEPTLNDLGETRESSYRSQVDEVDESLYKLIEHLKQKKIWNKTTVILAGLNGYFPEMRTTEPYPLNLYSENTRVSLFVKPATENRQTPMSWKVDSNVSLVDIGATLYDVFGAHMPRSERTMLTVGSLLPFLKGPNVSSEPLNENRWIMTESAWPQQQGLSGGVRFALRKGSLFFLYDNRRKLFDTLTDNMEFNPLPDYDESSIATRVEFEKYFRKLGLAAWLPPDREILLKLEMGASLWRKKTISDEAWRRLKNFEEHYRSDEQLRGWRAIWALRRQDWRDLKLTAVQKKHEDIWTYVAEANLGEKVEIGSVANSCFVHAVTLLHGKSGAVPRDCSSSELLALYDLLSNGESSRRQHSLDTLSKQVMHRMLDERVAEQNYATGGVWDISLEKPSQPALVDLILALPEAKKSRLALHERLKSL